MLSNALKKNGFLVYILVIILAALCIAGIVVDNSSFSAITVPTETVSPGPEKVEEETIDIPFVRFTYEEADILIAKLHEENNPTKAHKESKQTARAAEQYDIYEYDNSGTYLGTFYCTAYCPCYECSEGYGDMTSTGVRARSYHTIAVDPSVLPYGTKVVINGIVYTAEDCGGGVRGKHIDIYFDTHYEAMNYDTGYHDVYIY